PNGMGQGTGSTGPRSSPKPIGTKSSRSLLTFIEKAPHSARRHDQATRTGGEILTVETMKFKSREKLGTPIAKFTPKVGTVLVLDFMQGFIVKCLCLSL